MSKHFGARAVTLSGLAARALGWAPETFWQATPADLANALATPGSDASEALDRAGLNRLMEDKNGRD